MEQFKIKELTSPKFGIKVKRYDFSTKTPEKIALDLVTSVASVCYQSNSAGSERLFKMLEEESHNLPSSAFEFVPVTINKNMSYIKKIINKSIEKDIQCNIYKYGYKIHDNKWVTNLRALHYDRKAGIVSEDEYNEFMNTTIDLHMPIYKIENINMYTFGQLVRHREASFQVKSRRYVSNDKSPFTFNVEGLKGTGGYDAALWNCDNSLFQYEQLIERGSKKEVARGIIPQFATTELYFKFNSPSSYQNFMNIRLPKKAQAEIRELAETVKNL